MSILYRCGGSFKRPASSAGSGLFPFDLAVAKFQLDTAIQPP